MDGADLNGTNKSYAYMFRRAPGFFDVVAYEGNDSNDNKAHNLGVVPELMIIKTRNRAYNWRIYHKLYGEESGILLTSMAFSPSYDVWNDKAPTSSEFFVTPAHSNANASGNDYIAYLFATLPGVSKVGSYTGNGTPGQIIDCGFSNGARFVLIKNADAARDWWVFDTERGITSGNSDPGLRLNTTTAEYTGSNYECVGPNSSGFALTGSQGGQDFNENGENYIFLAIA